MLSCLGVVAFVVSPAPIARFGCMRRATFPIALEDDIVDINVEDSAYSQCMAMRVSEIKAELALRKINSDGLFEKEELARLLADSRRDGRADPSLLDEFNKQSAEQVKLAPDAGKDSD